MADRYWVGGGSSNDWDATGNTNWSTTSGGANNASVPVAGDDVIFDNNGTDNCTVATAEACDSITFDGGTGYTGTFTLNADLDVVGDITLSSGMSTAGTFNFNIGAACTLTGNGTAFPGIDKDGSGDLTLADNIEVTNTFDWNPGNDTTSLSGSFEIDIKGGFIVARRMQIGTGSPTIKLSGTGTWSGSSNANRGIEVPVEIDTSGTITFGTTGPFLRDGTLTYTSGTVVTTGSTFRIRDSCTLNGCSFSFNTVETEATTTLTIDTAWTLTQLTLNHNLTMVGNYTVTVTNIFSNASVGQITRVNEWTISGLITANGGDQIQFLGAYDQTVHSIRIESNGDIEILGGQKLTCTTAFEAISSIENVSTILGSSNTTQIDFEYQGTAANLKLANTRFQYVDCTATHADFDDDDNELLCFAGANASSTSYTGVKDFGTEHITSALVAAEVWTGYVPRTLTS